LIFYFVPDPFLIGEELDAYGEKWDAQVQLLWKALAQEVFFYLFIKST
jgi:hypothetical protein